MRQEWDYQTSVIQSQGFAMAELRVKDRVAIIEQMVTKPSA